MISFLTGLALLAAGAIIYGRVSEKVIKPTDRKTPAVEKYDGVDYVPMKKWKNSLIELLNIAGTGPIPGPIQGILFGLIAFITIPIGCVLGGAFHDYMSGMISVRNDGEQMPSLVKRFLGNIGAGVLSFAYGVVLAVYGGGVRREPKKLKRYRNIWKSQSSQTGTAPTGTLTPTRAVSRRKAAANG